MMTDWLIAVYSDNSILGYPLSESAKRYGYDIGGSRYSVRLCETDLGEILALFQCEIIPLQYGDPDNV